MYIIKNALKNITRNKGRNILIVIIVTVIAAACSVTLSIMNSATKVVNSYEEKYDIESTIATNREALMKILRGDDGEASQEEMIENYKKIKALTVEEIDNYGKSDYVESYYYISEISMDGKDLTKATDNIMKETTETKTETKTQKKTYKQQSGSDKSGFPGGGFPGGFTPEISTSTKTTTKISTKILGTEGGDFDIKGYSSYESMTEFVDGTYTIKDGKVFTDFSANVCIISEELANINNLKVGDKITLVNPDNSKLTYEVEITGIFTSSADDSESMSNMFSSSANTIITNATVTAKIAADDENITNTLTPTFIMKDKNHLEDFKNEVTKKGLSEYYTVNNNLEEIEGATKSITNVKTFATTFLLITLLIGAVVLLVLNSLTIRERKYEIGVLRTIGMKKMTVVTQFVLELIIVATIGLCIGGGIGAYSSVPIANKLLENEISTSTSDFDKIDKNFGGAIKAPGGDDNSDSKRPSFQFSGVSNIEQVDSIEAVMDIKVLLELLGIGLLLTIISSLSACIAIARFQPLTILKERS